MPTNDPVARQSLAALVDALLGEPDQPGEMCGVTLPGGETFQSLATSSELEFFSRLIRLRGFFPQVLSAGMAAVLAELSRQCFTGLGLSFGAATSELVVAHRGIELLMCSIRREAIGSMSKSRKSSATRSTTSRVSRSSISPNRQRRHSSARHLSPANSETDRFLAGLHRDLVYALIRSATFALARQPQVIEIPQPLPVTVVGGVSHRRFRPTIMAGLRNGPISAVDP